MFQYQAVKLPHILLPDLTIRGVSQKNLAKNIQKLNNLVYCHQIH